MAAPKSQELLKEVEELRVDFLSKLGKRRRSGEWEGHEEEVEKFDKAIKERILNDLSSWALEPQGRFYRVDGKLKVIVVDMGSIGKRFFDVIYFENNYKSKYRNEIVNAFINEIKQSPRDWKIELREPKEVILNGRPFNYGRCWAVKHKSGRTHYKPDEREHRLFFSFLPEEWTEIENALNNQQKIPFKENEKKEIENDNYDDKSLTYEELNKKIQKVKTEIEELKTNNQNINSSEWQIELKKKKEELAKLEQLKIIRDNKPNPQNSERNNSNNKFPTGLIIGGAVLLAIIGLTVLIIVGNKKKRKKQLN